MKGFYNQRSNIKRKRCAVVGCNMFAWGGGFCKGHQFLREAKKPIPKYKPRKTAPTHKYGFKTLPELFMAVVYAAPRPIICPVSGEDITKLFSEDFDIWKCCCAHILSRGKYPMWRLNPYNIVLLHPEAHKLFDQGTEAQRQGKKGWNWDYLYTLQEQLKKEYDDEYRKENGPFYDPASLDAKNQDGETDGQEGDDDVSEDADADRDGI